MNYGDMKFQYKRPLHLAAREKPSEESRKYLQVRSILALAYLKHGRRKRLLKARRLSVHYKKNLLCIYGGKMRHCWRSWQRAVLCVDVASIFITKRTQVMNELGDTGTTIIAICMIEGKLLTFCIYAGFCTAHTNMM